jgi:hypothetical protein
MYYEGGAVIVHKARLLIACWERGGREHPLLTHIQSNACRFLFLLFSYLRFAEAASFDKKELCRSDTGVNPLVEVLNSKDENSQDFWTFVPITYKNSASEGDC